MCVVTSSFLFLDVLSSKGLQPKSDGLRPKSNGLQPKSDGLQPNSGGLQPKSDGLQPNSGGLHLVQIELILTHLQNLQGLLANHCPRYPVRLHLPSSNVSSIKTCYGPTNL